MYQASQIHWNVLTHAAPTPATSGLIQIQFRIVDDNLKPADLHPLQDLDRSRNERPSAAADDLGDFLHRRLFPD